MSDSHWQTAALLNDRTRAAIRDRRQAGESIADLAKDYGVPEAFVEALCAWQLGQSFQVKDEPRPSITTIPLARDAIARDPFRHLSPDAAQPHSPQSVETLVREMLKIYAVKFNNQNSEEVAVQTWARQFYQLASGAALVPRLRELVANWNVNASLASGQATMEPQGSLDWVRQLRECKIYRACADELHALLAARVREGA